MKPGHTKWTEDELNRLVAMLKDDCGIEDIAAALGRSETSVKARAYSMTALWSAERPVQRVPAALHTNLTSFIMGDPVPGRSALDQKRAGQ